MQKGVNTKTDLWNTVKMINKNNSHINLPKKRSFKNKTQKFTINYNSPQIQLGQKIDTLSQYLLHFASTNFEKNC